MSARLLPACQRAFGACRSALCTRADWRPLHTVPAAAAAFESLWARTHPLPHVNLLQLWIGNPKCYTYIPKKKPECSVLTSFLLFCFCTEELVFDFKSKIKEEVSLKHCAWPWFFLAKSYFNKYLFVIYLYFNTIFYVKPVLGMTPLSKNYCLTWIKGILGFKLLQYLFCMK